MSDAREHAAADLRARVAALHEIVSAARSQAARLVAEVEAEREEQGPTLTWGDERFQQSLRDGGGGENARRLQTEVDAGRVSWDELRRGDAVDPRYRDLLTAWGRDFLQNAEEGRRLAEQEAGGRGTDPVARPLPRTRDGGAGAGSR